MKILETERLILRTLTPEDEDNLAAIFMDPVAMRYYPSTKSRVEIRFWLQRAIDSYAEYGFGLWGIELKGTGVFVGECGLVPQSIDDREEIEIGYHVLRMYWRQGIATEAAIACRDHAIGKLGFDRLISLINPHNAPSRRVAEKTGMTLESMIMWRNRMTCLYSLERSVATQ